MSDVPLYNFTRRAVLAVGAGIVASPVYPQDSCQLGLPGHVEGPHVWRDYDQVELDAAYRQETYQPHTESINSRLAALSFDLRFRRGYPERAFYGSAPDEGMDIYRAEATNAPVFVFLHGGIWLYLNAAMSGFAAEMFLDQKFHFVALDFSPVNMLDGDLAALSDQVRRGIAWVVKNAAGFGGDPARIYIGGHSSGGHLAAVALTTDWTTFGLPADVIKGGLLMSGLYDMEPVRLSWRRNYISFTDTMEDATSPIRHLDRINAPVTITYGSLETPEFQRQAKDFASALQAKGKAVEIIQASAYFHQDMWETLGNPYGANGRAALAMIKR